ncbi:MAG TPA: MBL fold metallo-hydrolase [Roseiflexaceae bacterium]|nr:MBL fold metallo-hydrolase [Roseiflexaceae bacterium]
MQAASDVHLVPNSGWDERILVARCGRLVDVFVIVTARYVVLVDTLINTASAAALLEIARPHLAGRQLLVVNTHAHYDHAWGNQLFAGPGATYPAPVIATRRCAEVLCSAEAEEFLRRMQERDSGAFGGVRLTPPDITFDERLTIAGGDLTLELFLTPGHAPDHLAIWIPEIRTLLPGDAAESPFPFVESAATLPQLRDSLARMAALDPAEALYCHAPLDAGPALIRQNMAYFDELERRCRAALARGVPARPEEGADVAALVGFPFVDAVPPGHTVTQPEFYIPGHAANIRATLECYSAVEVSPPR